MFCKSFKFILINFAMKLNFLPFFLLFMTLTHTSFAEPKKLPVCANTPNCVSSLAEDKDHFIAPFKIKGSTTQVFTELKALLSQQVRVLVTHETHDSLHAEATSLVFRFVDDIDMVVDEAAGLIHIRSASRTGYSDFGVNRRRVEALRSQLQKARLID